MSSFDILMAEAVFALAAAPLAGVALPALRPIAAGIAVATAASMAGHWAAAGASTAALRPILAVHATLAAAALALAAIGALYRTLLADVLDAAALALATAALAVFGILVIGPAALDLPARLLNLALIANPLVAIASAAEVDMFRGQLLYHLSPIAHRQFEYPAWYSAAGVYIVVAAAALATAASHRRHSVPQA